MNNDKDKKIIKSPAYSLKKLSEDSSLAKRGLRDIGIWPKVQTLLKEIEKQYFAHNYQKCIDICDEALASEPLLYVPLCFKALCLVRLEKYEEAIIWFDKALQTELPLEITPLEQKYEKATPVYTKPDLEIVIGNKGFCLLQLEKYEEAITCFNKALEINPQNYINLENKGLCLEKLGRIDEAVDNYEKSLILRPINDKYYDFKDFIDKYFGLTYEKSGSSDILQRVNKFNNLNEFDICLVILEELLNRENNNLDAKIWKARILQKQEKYPEAVQLFTECLSIEKGYAFVWQFRGDCYWKIGDYKNALSDYLRAIELDPTNGVVYDNVAMCFFNLSEYSKAHEYIDQAISLENGNDMPMIRKAQFFEFQGKIAEALEQYKKTLAVFPTSEYTNKKVLELSKSL
ncbi:MAG: tetratricopeptide repeat protein [Candidatus Vogelbacteria bacterium]